MATRLSWGVAIVTLGCVLGPVGAGAQLPPEAYRFHAIYDDYRFEGARIRRVAEFTPEGPIAGTFLRGSLSTSHTHVAVDPRGPDFYATTRGMMSSRLNAETGETTPLPYTDDELDNHPTGLTFDTKRNRLVLSTMGGEGFLHAYSPETNAWSRLAGLDNEDLFSVTYSAFDDAFYALVPGGVVVRYDAAGRPAGTVALASPLPAYTHLDLFEPQLVASGDGLVLLAPAPPDLTAALVAPAQRSYFINPRTGTVQALGAVRIVPEPAAGALLALAAGLLVRRRVGR